MAKPILLTEDGLKKLENEIETLKTVTRNEIAEKIKIARGFGDLSENSEYDEAKNEQAKVEARIIEVESMLKNVQLIDDDDIGTNQITIGATVKVLDIEYNDELIYKIVGSAEADPKNGKISDESPVGKALIGRSEGDEVIAEAPAGHITFKVLKISK
ncbi:MAG: transcription elongation factor GreA [Oscillospiraceae bacterium]|nr:transcription elongation factor GreA [Oscillospiraceae bacterium]